MKLAIDRLGTIHDLVNGVRWTAEQLAAEVERRAKHLAGVRPGSIVAITHGGTAAFFADLFAVWSRGAAAACLDPALTPSERNNVIAFCKASAVVTEAGVTATEQSAHRAPQDAALILFTSGTTGAPKGVVLSAQALIARAELNRRAIGDETMARTLVTLPTHFGHGLIGNALTPLLARGDIFLPARGLSLAQQLGSHIDKHDITFMSSVPSLWQIALRMSPRPTKQTLQRVHIGSAPLSATTWQRIQEWCVCPVVNCYGITETSNWIAGASTAEHPPSDGFVGKPWGGRAGVVGADDKIQASGEGEIAIQSPALMTGYLDRPDLTSAVLKDGWYRTGDLGEVNERGEIRLTGRAKDEINRAGFKIQPAEIDMLLERHPQVAEACTFGAPDAISGEVVAVAVRLTPGATETAQTLRDWCQTYLRREATPERWFFVDEIPKTSRGKVSRDTVRKSLLEKS